MPTPTRLSRRILGAVLAFATSAALLTATFSEAFAKSRPPVRVAVVGRVPAQAPVEREKVEKKKPRAKAFLPVHDFGGY